MTLKTRALNVSRMDTNIVRRFSDAIAANMAKLRLVQHGINASVLESTRLYGTCTEDACLMVPEDDAIQAFEILESSEEAIVCTEGADAEIGHAAAEDEVSGPSVIGQFFNAEVLNVKIFMWFLWGCIALFSAFLLMHRK